MTLQDRQQIFAQNVALLINYIYIKGFKCTMGEAFRTEEQAAIYAKEDKGVRDSLHCKRLALDLNLFTANGTYVMNSAIYKPFGMYWQSLHPDNVWGGCFVSKSGKKRQDGNHFECSDKPQGE